MFGLHRRERIAYPAVQVSSFSGAFNGVSSQDTPGSNFFTLLLHLRCLFGSLGVPIGSIGAGLNPHEFRWIIRVGPESHIRQKLEVIVGSGGPNL